MGLLNTRFDDISSRHVRVPVISTRVCVSIHEPYEPANELYESRNEACESANEPFQMYL